MSNFYKRHPGLFLLILMTLFYGLAFFGAYIGIVTGDVRIGEAVVLAVLLSIPFGSYLRHRIRWGISFRKWYMEYW